MKPVRPLLVLLAALALLPAGLRADWSVVDYDGRADWVRHDFVGWVRVEQVVKGGKFAKGTAAVTLKVIEKLSGNEAAAVFTLEYEARPPVKKGEIVEPNGKHYWNDDVPSHREYFVFLNRLPNGAYWCDDQREFEVRDGHVLNLPRAYDLVGSGDAAPGAHELISRVRASVPAFKVRVGRPDFVPPYNEREKGRLLETPQQGFEHIRTALQAGDGRELDRLIHSPDGSAPKTLRAVLLQEKANLSAWPVSWQAVLDDKAVIVLGPPGQPGATLYLMRRGPRWLLLNTSPDTEAGRFQLNLLLTESQFAVLTAVLERDHRGLMAAPR